MRRVQNKELVYYQFALFDDLPGFAHGVFTRLGGVSPTPFDSLNVGLTVGDDVRNVQANREQIAETLAASDSDARTTWQVHGSDVVVVRGRDPQPWPPPQADAIVTVNTETPLTMRFADCVPLVYVDPVKRAFGLAHAGWRGTLGGVGAAMVQTMRAAFDSQPHNIRVGIGPSIGPCCYEIGEDVDARFRAAFGPQADSFIHRRSHAKPHLDLWSANEYVLRQAGVEQIETAKMCTATSTDEFYSHRAEGGNTGRFGVIALMREGR